MVVSGIRVGLVAMGGLLLVALLVVGCTRTRSTTSSAVVPSTGTSIGAPATASDAPSDTTMSTTATTLPPGFRTFETVTEWFEEGLAQTNADNAWPGLAVPPEEVLPYSVMPAEQLVWLKEQAFTVTEAKGYELVNGDAVVLFDQPLLRASDEDVHEAWNSLNTVAEGRYAGTDQRVWTFVTGGFGFVVVSKDYWSELGGLAQWAMGGYVPPEQTGTTTHFTTAGNIGPAHDFFWGLRGDGYVAYKLEHEQEGETTVFVVGVRVDTDKEARATYDTIYHHATSSAKRYGIATGRGQLLRVVLVEATPEQKIIESQDFDLTSSRG